MYDLCVIGSGPGGFTAAIQAASNNLKVCLVEKDVLGGVCLNCGCIPTKSLLFSSKVLSLCKESEGFGINLENINLDFKKVSERKSNIIQALRKQLESFLKFKKVDILNGEAELLDVGKVRVSGEAIETKYIILATGSTPKELPSIKFDKNKVISSKELLAIDQIPKNLLIVGAGVIGCEFANIFSVFGSNVTVVEILDEILPPIEREISSKLKRIFQKKGIKIQTKTDASKMNRDEFDKVLVCVGRNANIKIAGLDKIGVKTDKRIVVDEFLRTNINNIFAIGDCIGPPLLAHAASYEARVAVGNILGKDVSADYSSIPNCIYTYPQIASVGLREDELKEKNTKFFVKKFLFNAVGKAHILAETDGLLKIIVGEDSNKIIGASIIGPEATEIIASLAVAVKLGLTLEQLKSVVYAHPTLSEIISEATHL